MLQLIFEKLFFLKRKFDQQGIPGIHCLTSNIGVSLANSLKIV